MHQSLGTYGFRRSTIRFRPAGHHHIRHGSFDTGLTHELQAWPIERGLNAAVGQRPPAVLTLLLAPLSNLATGHVLAGSPRCCSCAPADRSRDHSSGTQESVRESTESSRTNAVLPQRNLHPPSSPFDGQRRHCLPYGFFGSTRRFFPDPQVVVLQEEI